MTRVAGIGGAVLVALLLLADRAGAIAARPQASSAAGAKAGPTGTKKAGAERRRSSSPVKQNGKSEGGTYGLSVAADAQYTVVGAPSARVGGRHVTKAEEAEGEHGERYGVPEAGEAFVYRSADDKLLFKLAGPDPTEGGEFGGAVAISGDLGAVSGDGEVFIYNAGTGTVLQTLASPESEGEGEFGGALALDGEQVAVGSSDGVYLFNDLTGQLEQTLKSPNDEDDDGFGISVALSGRYVIVGSSLESINSMAQAGRAYVFSATTGALLHTLSSPTPEEKGSFGYSVAANGNLVAVGTVREGKAYVFNAKTGAMQYGVTNPNASTSENLRFKGGFGYNVALNGKNLVVGAPFNTANNPSEAKQGSEGLVGGGAAYVYKASSGHLERTLTSKHPTTEGLYGWSVAVAGKKVVAGAPGESVDGSETTGNIYSTSAEDSGGTRHSKPSPTKKPESPKGHARPEAERPKGHARPEAERVGTATSPAEPSPASALHGAAEAPSKHHRVTPPPTRTQPLASLEGVLLNPEPAAAPRQREGGHASGPKEHEGASHQSRAPATEQVRVNPASALGLLLVFLAAVVAVLAGALGELLSARRFTAAQ